jgi:hypothetical protein
MTNNTPAFRFAVPAAVLLLLVALGLASCGGGGPKEAGKPGTPSVPPHSGTEVTGGFDDLFRFYHPGAPEDTDARDEAWSTYGGNVVTWAGPFYRASKTADGLEIEIVHARMPSGRPAGRAVVLLGPDQAAAAFNLVPGQVVTYRARVARVEQLPEETIIRLDGGSIVRVRDRD